MLTIIILSILIQSSVLNQEINLALEEYKQVAAENRSYRTYRAESGLRGNLSYQFSDADGYRWYMSSEGGTKIYLLNGIRYNDVMSADQFAIRDTLLGTLLQSKTTKTVYSAGRRNLYQWKGYFWKPYAFPTTDKILRLLGYEDDIYCLGEHGIGILKKGIWDYQPFKGSISETEARLAHIGKDGSVLFAALSNAQEATVSTGQNSFIRAPILTKDNDLHLKLVSPKGASSLLVLSGKSMFDKDIGAEYKIPQTWLDYSEDILWVFLSNTDLLYKYDLQQNRLHKIALEPGTKIQSVTGTDKGTGWLITQNSGSIQATELLPGYPATKGMSIRSQTMAFRADYLDYLYLQEQLIPVLGKYRPTYSDKYSLIRILEPDNGTSTFINKELANPYPQSICKQVYNMGNLLFLDMKHDMFQDVSRIVIIEYPFKQTTTRDILLDSEIYTLAYNRQMDSIIYQRSGAISVIPLEIICEEVFQAPMQQKQSNYLSITKLNGNRFVSYTDIGKSQKQLSLGRLHAGDVQHLATIPSAKVIGTDLAADLIYLRSNGNMAKSEPDLIKAYSFKQAKLIELETLNANASFSPFPGGYHILNGDSMKTISFAKDANSPALPSESRPLTAFQRNVVTPLKIDNFAKWQGKDRGKSLSSTLLEMVDYVALDKQWIGAAYTKLMLSNHEIKPYPGQTTSKYRISELPEQVHFGATDGRTLNLPTHIYNLLDDKMYPKPLWIKFFPPYQQKHYIGHLEKLSHKRYRYRVSQFSSGKLILQTDNFKLDIAGEYVPAINAYYSDAGQMYSDGKNLYYRLNKSWHTLNMKQYELYGKLNNVTVFNKVVWLCFTQALVRFDTDKLVSYAYTSKEGIPNDLEEVFTENGILMLKTMDTIYSFSEYNNDLKLDIPYIIVADSIRVGTTGKIKLPYKHRRLDIPISILGPLYPELCQISYRLRGFTNDWVTKPYVETIRYEKLPYGYYTFEVNAVAANGEQTPVRSIPIRINPPLYYTWYAFVIYALAFLGVIFAIIRWQIYRYRQINHQLEAQVALRTHELQEWQLRMTQSIEYALLIQKSILPQADQMRKVWQEFFVLWHPRDVVGGDFYWLHELPGTKSVLFAVIDCTGHGVPGALVSMTVNAALNHIVTEHGGEAPDEILRQLHEDIGLTMHQESERTQQDGLDISIIKVDMAEHILSFAGAALDMMVYDNASHSLQVLNGSKFSIGGLKHHKNPIFDSQQIAYSPGSKIYLYTDGILDQPNEMKPRTKRLGPENWFKLISVISELPLIEQNEHLEAKISQMMLLSDQRDDITIVGLQI